MASFGALKEALAIAPALQLPNFDEQFIIECDTSGSGIGAVLQQDGHPIAFFSRQLAVRHFKLAAYERELIGLAKAVQHWRPYLWGRPFLIRTDHYSLKYLLEQRLTTSPQQYWISKLMGFDFCVEYRAGHLNKVADALSRRPTLEEFVYAISQPRVLLLDAIRREISNDASLQELVQQILRHEFDASWSFENGLLIYKGRIYLLPSSQLLSTILSGYHDAHEGVQKTLHRIRQDFYWKGMKLVIRDYVAACPVCQRNKAEHLRSTGLLQPLALLEQVWADIEMDFINGLPKAWGKTVLFVVVERFSKYAHFIPMSHPYNATRVAHIFFENCFVFVAQNWHSLLLAILKLMVKQKL